jgi:hypothetical protein
MSSMRALLIMGLWLGWIALLAQTCAKPATPVPPDKGSVAQIVAEELEKPVYAHLREIRLGYVTKDQAGTEAWQPADKQAKRCLEALGRAGLMSRPEFARFEVGPYGESGFLWTASPTPTARRWVRSTVREWHGPDRYYNGPAAKVIVGTPRLVEVSCYSPPPPDYHKAVDVRADFHYEWDLAPFAKVFSEETDACLEHEVPIDTLGGWIVFNKDEGGVWQPGPLRSDYGPDLNTDVNTVR